VESSDGVLIGITFLARRWSCCRDESYTQSDSFSPARYLKSEAL